MFTRYLLDRECPEEMQERYASGCVARSLADNDEVTSFVRQHPDTLPFIDAAGAIAGRASELRARLQLMAAILEASPRFADAFLAAPSTRARAIASLAASGMASAAKAALGLPLLIALESAAT